jgi:DNA-binding IclR family transcriptional regulator
LGVLELFLGDRAELSSRDITDALDLPRTTAHELTSTLVQLGYLSPGLHDPRSFRLGVKVLQLGSTYGERLDLAVEGRPVAQRIALECSETVHVAIRDGTDVVYIVKIDSTRSVRMVSAQGRRLPAHCTAIGKMLLSSMTEDQIDVLYRGVESLPALTPTTITSVDGLKAALAQIRKDHYALDARESTPEVDCVAAPVYDQTGDMVAAMSISVPLIRWSTRTPQEWAQLITSGADDLSYRLGSAANTA